MLDILVASCGRPGECSGNLSAASPAFRDARGLRIAWCSSGHVADALAREAIEVHGALQKRSELRALVSYLAGRPLRRVVEIGTARGGTLWLWTRLAEHDATIVSIDLPVGPLAGERSERISAAFASWRRPSQRLVLLRGDSHDAAMRDRCARVCGGPVDLLFVDGDHSYAGCRADLEMYLPLVRPGGLAVLHDILPHLRVPSCQVDRLWRELRPLGAVREFVDPEDDRGWGQWGGIGVLIVE